MGINKAGDIANLIMPTIIPNALDDDSIIIGNSPDMNNELSFIFMDTLDIGFITVGKMPLQTYVLLVSRCSRPSYLE